MGRTAGFEGLRCVACGDEQPPTSDAMRCPSCGGALSVVMDATAADWSPSDGGQFDMWSFGTLLPHRAPSGDLRAGGTPLVEAPAAAEATDAGRVLVKDESRNPTGSVWDRDFAVACRAAASQGASTVALPAPGAAGQAAAAAGARMDLSVHAYIPSRANFTTKATVNVAGGEMTVVPGRYADAQAAFADAMADEDWHSVEPGVNPFLRAGRWTLYWELLAALDGTPPDVVVAPVATGGGLAALVEAAGIARRIGVADRLPTFVAVQPAGCAPIVEAFERGERNLEPVDHPDTICGELEIPDPAGGRIALSALHDAGGVGLTVHDEALYRSALALAREDGIVPSLSGGAAAAALESIPDLDGTETVVVLNLHSGLADADRLRSYLMSQGE